MRPTAALHNISNYDAIICKLEKIMQPDLLLLFPGISIIFQIAFWT